MPVSAAIERYLRTGDHDPYVFDWSGDVIERERRAHDDLKRALVDEVSRRAAGCRPSAEVPTIDLTSFTCAKVEPMVRGLFPEMEQEVMLRVLERSVVFLTPDRVESILLGCTWLHTAWCLANLYLGSLGAELLVEDAPRIVGFSAETTCFVSLDYFTETNRFTDFIVHEAAHVFHNCKRLTVGMPEMRRREWLLEIAFQKRETFAYGCEAFSRVVDICPKIKDRLCMISRSTLRRSCPAMSMWITMSSSTSSARPRKHGTGGSASSRAAPRAESHARLDQRTGKAAPSRDRRTMPSLARSASSARWS